MFNSTSMRASDNSRPSKKHRRSSSDLTDYELESLTRGLKAIKDKIKAVQAEYHLRDLEELEHLDDEASNALQQVKVIQNLKRKDENAMVISLSHVDKEILSNRLGIQQTRIINVDRGSPVAFLDKLLPALERQGVSHNLDTITNIVNHHWNNAPLLDTLSTVQKNVNKKSEAASRIIIDAWLLHGIRLINSMNQKYRTVLFPEYLIWSRNSESDDPPAIRHGHNVTYLAGTSDYALLSILPSYGDKPVPKRKVRKVLLENDNATRALNFFTSHDTLNIYEAKRVSASLIDHEAQVIAECLAIMAKWNASHDDHIRNLAFTLTSGEAWVFGIVDLEGRVCVRTAETFVDIEVMKEGKDRSLQSLMSLILIWSTQSAEAIKAAMHIVHSKQSIR